MSDTTQSDNIPPTAATLPPGTVSVGGAAKAERRSAQREERTKTADTKRPLLPSEQKRTTQPVGGGAFGTTARPLQQNPPSGYVPGRDSNVGGQWFQTGWLSYLNPQAYGTQNPARYSN